MSAVCTLCSSVQTQREQITTCAVGWENSGQKIMTNHRSGFHYDHQRCQLWSELWTSKKKRSKLWLSTWYDEGVGSDCHTALCRHYLIGDHVSFQFPFNSFNMRNFQIKCVCSGSVMLSLLWVRILFEQCLARCPTFRFVPFARPSGGLAAQLYGLIGGVGAANVFFARSWMRWPCSVCRLST